MFMNFSKNSFFLLFKDGINFFTSFVLVYYLANYYDSAVSAAYFFLAASLSLSKSIVKVKVVEYWLIKISHNCLSKKDIFFGYSFDLLTRLIGLCVFFALFLNSQYSAALNHGFILSILLLGLIFDSLAVFSRFYFLKTNSFIALSICSAIPSLITLFIIYLSFYKYLTDSLFFQCSYIILFLPSLFLVPYLYFSFKIINHELNSSIFSSKSFVDFFFWGFGRSLLIEPVKNGFLVLVGLFSSSDQMVIARVFSQVSLIGPRFVSALRPIIFNSTLLNSQSLKNPDNNWGYISFFISTVFIIPVLFVYIDYPIILMNFDFVIFCYIYILCVSYWISFVRFSIIGSSEFLSKLLFLSLYPYALILILLFYFLFYFYPSYKISLALFFIYHFISSFMIGHVIKRSRS